MKHRKVLREGQMRKYYTFLNNCANQVNSPALKAMILSRRINWRKSDTTVQKG